MISMALTMNAHSMHNIIHNQDVSIKNAYLKWLLSYATQKRKQRFNIVRRVVVRNAYLRQPDLDVLKHVVTSKAVDSLYIWSYKYYKLSKAEADIIEFILSTIN